MTLAEYRRAKAKRAAQGKQETTNVCSSCGESGHNYFACVPARQARQLEALEGLVESSCKMLGFNFEAKFDKRGSSVLLVEFPGECVLHLRRLLRGFGRPSNCTPKNEGEKGTDSKAFSLVAE